ncbi:MAG TPA: LuxR C-terminal-related transcriptional regulator [Aeromicrobium sp.]|nr:LuxR C-terminal-related transcriptional regulator [Aeromicrobium sp.]
MTSGVGVTSDDQSADSPPEFTRRLEVFTRIHRELAKLRQAETVETIVSRAPQAACDACGLDRAIIYRVRGNDMFAEAAYVRDDPASTQEFLEWSRANPGPLQDRILESEMVRRRIPLLVLDALNHPDTFKPMVEHYQTHSYVTAPIMPDGRVIGFLNADKAFQHPGDPAGVDEFDRDALWAFVEGLGSAIERAHVREKIRSKLEEADGLMTQMRAVVADLLQSNVELVKQEAGIATSATGAAAALLRNPGSPIRQLLSRREIEVLELAAHGWTNPRIAARLFITEGTVKSHVGQILRKLGVTNRVEAVGLYLRQRTPDGS